MRITWNNRKEILEQLDKASCIKFAVFCAEQVKYLNDDPAIDAAIDAAKVWLASPNEENADAARTAANAAYTAYCATNAAAAVAAYYVADAATYAAANAANAAYCTYAAVNAADAAYCTYAVAYAARAAYYAADAAAYVTNTADINKEQIKQEQVNYLKQLYLESLPENERNCWLVRAAIGV